MKVKSFELNDVQIIVNKFNDMYQVLRMPGIDHQAPFNLRYDQADDLFEYFVEKELEK